MTYMYHESSVMTYMYHECRVVRSYHECRVVRSYHECRVVCLTMTLTIMGTPNVTCCVASIMMTVRLRVILITPARKDAAPISAYVPGYTSRNIELINGMLYVLC